MTNDLEKKFGSPAVRYVWVDALRGFAAVIVVISHVSLFGLYGYEHALATIPPTRLLWSGHQAVILFFAISGFSLYLLFEGMQPVRWRYLRFVASRFIRLYPPYFVALLLGLAVLGGAYTFGLQWPAALSQIARGDLDAGTLLGHATMIGVFNVTAINPPIWSLVHEARWSIAFPLIYFAVRAGNWQAPAIAIALAAFSMIYVFGVDGGHLPWNPYMDSIRRSASYGVDFTLGAIIAKHRAEIASWIGAQGRLRVVVATLIALFAFMYSFNYDWGGVVPRVLKEAAALATAGSSGWFLMLALSTGAPCPRPVKFFGTISYSLYLAHQPVVMLVALLFFGALSAPQLWLVSISLSIGVAWVLYVCVEKPSKTVSFAIRQPSRAAIQPKDFTHHSERAALRPDIEATGTEKH